jgi:GMP synthase (glutamine-hydrolysing)
MNPRGIIFTGGPNSVYGEGAPLCEKELFELGIPILGICYGSQAMAYMLGGTVETVQDGGIHESPHRL